MIREILQENFLHLILILHTRLPSPWDICKVQFKRNLKRSIRLFVNNGSYFLVYFFFVIWFIKLVLRQFTATNRKSPGKREFYIIVGLSLASASQLLWPILLLINYFIACSFYPWTTALIVIFLHLSLNSSLFFALTVRRSRELIETISHEMDSGRYRTSIEFTPTTEYAPSRAVIIPSGEEIELSTAEIQKFLDIRDPKPKNMDSRKTESTILKQSRYNEVSSAESDQTQQVEIVKVFPLPVTADKNNKEYQEIFFNEANRTVYHPTQNKASHYGNMSVNEHSGLQTAVFEQSNSNQTKLSRSGHLKVRGISNVGRVTVADDIKINNSEKYPCTRTDVPLQIFSHDNASSAGNLRSNVHCKLESSVLPNHNQIGSAPSGCMIRIEKNNAALMPETADKRKTAEKNYGRTNGTFIIHSQDTVTHINNFKDTFVKRTTRTSGISQDNSLQAINRNSSVQGELKLSTSKPPKPRLARYGLTQQIGMADGGLNKMASNKNYKKKQDSIEKRKVGRVRFLSEDSLIVKCKLCKSEELFLESSIWKSPKHQDAIAAQHIVKENVEKNNFNLTEVVPHQEIKKSEGITSKRKRGISGIFKQDDSATYLKQRKVRSKSKKPVSDYFMKVHFKSGYCGHCGKVDNLPYRRGFTDLRKPYVTRAGHLYGPTERFMATDEYVREYGV